MKNELKFNQFVTLMIQFCNKIQPCIIRYTHVMKTENAHQGSSLLLNPFVKRDVQWLSGNFRPQHHRGIYSKNHRNQVFHKMHSCAILTQI